MDNVNYSTVIAFMRTTVGQWLIKVPKTIDAQPSFVPVPSPIDDQNIPNSISLADEKAVNEAIFQEYVGKNVPVKYVFGEWIRGINTLDACPAPYPLLIPKAEEEAKLDDSTIKPWLLPLIGSWTVIGSVVLGLLLVLSLLSLCLRNRASAKEKAGYERSLKQRDRAIEKRNKDLEKLQEALDDEKAAKKTAETELKTTKSAKDAEIKSLDESHVAAISQVKEEKNDEINSITSTKDAEISGIQTEKNILAQQIAQFEKDLSASKAREESAAELLEAEQEKVTELVKEKEVLEAAVANAENVTTELQTVKQQKAALKEELTASKKNEDKLNQDKDSLEGQVLELTTSIDSANAEAERLRKIEEENITLKHEKKSLENDTRQLEAQRDEANGSKKRLTEELEQTKEQLTNTELSVTALEADRKTAEDALNNAQTAYASAMQDKDNEIARIKLEFEQQLQAALKKSAEEVEGPSLDDVSKDEEQQPVQKTIDNKKRLADGPPLTDDQAIERAHEEKVKVDESLDQSEPLEALPLAESEPLEEEDSPKEEDSLKEEDSPKEEDLPKEEDSLKEEQPAESIVPPTSIFQQPGPFVLPYDGIFASLAPPKPSDAKSEIQPVAEPVVEPENESGDHIPDIQTLLESEVGNENESVDQLPDDQPESDPAENVEADDEQSVEEDVEEDIEENEDLSEDEDVPMDEGEYEMDDNLEGEEDAEDQPVSDPESDSDDEGSEIDWSEWEGPDTETIERTQTLLSRFTTDDEPLALPSSPASHTVGEASAKRGLDPTAQEFRPTLHPTAQEFRPFQITPEDIPSLEDNSPPNEAADENVQRPESEEERAKRTMVNLHDPFRIIDDGKPPNATRLMGNSRFAPEHTSEQTSASKKLTQEFNRAFGTSSSGSQSPVNSAGKRARNDKVCRDDFKEEGCDRPDCYFQHPSGRAKRCPYDSTVRGCQRTVCRLKHPSVEEGICRFEYSPHGCTKYPDCTKGKHPSRSTTSADDATKTSNLTPPGEQPAHVTNGAVPDVLQPTVDGYSTVLGGGQQTAPLRTGGGLLGSRHGPSSSASGNSRLAVSPPGSSSSSGDDKPQPPTAPRSMRNSTAGGIHRSHFASSSPPAPGATPVQFSNRPPTAPSAMGNAWSSPASGTPVNTNVPAPARPLRGMQPSRHAIAENEPSPPDSQGAQFDSETYSFAPEESSPPPEAPTCNPPIGPQSMRASFGVLAAHPGMTPEELKEADLWKKKNNKNKWTRHQGTKKSNTPGAHFGGLGGLGGGRHVGRY